MKSIAAIVAMLFIAQFTRANNWSMQIVGERKIRLHFVFDNYKICSDSLSGKSLSHVQTPERTYTMQKFAPELPIFAQALWCSDTSRWTMRVVDSSYIEYPNITIAPFISKKDTSSALRFGAVYHRDQFWPTQHFVQGAIREFDSAVYGSNLRCFPVQYNAVRKTLRIFRTLTLECERPATEQLPLDRLNNEFRQLYAQYFANSLNNSRLKRLNTIPQRGKMLIVSPSEFVPSLKPFIEWKRKNGIECQIIDLHSFVGSEGLKKQIKQQCSNNSISYLLLVGDGNLVPSVPVMFDKAAVSDVEYAYLNDRDFYPDLMVGRWSGKTIADIEKLVSRSLQYEQSAVVNDPWPARYLLVASADNNRGDNGEYDFEHLQIIADNLQKMNYQNGSFLHDETSGEKLQLANFVQSFNKGNGLFFYTGHGSVSQLETSGFSGSACSELRNSAQLPFAVIAGCQVGHFVDTSCLAENLMLSSYQNQPTGTIAIMASSIDQEWNPPMYMQDKFIDLMKQFKSRNGLHTFGGLALAACYAMNDVYNNYAWSTTDTWILFGDPSLTIRTEAAHAISANYPKSVSINTHSLQFTCSDSLAYATLFQGNTFLGFSHCDANKLDFSSFSLKSLSPIVITINAPNAVPIIDTIKVTESNNSYLTISELHLSSKIGEIGRIASYADTLSLSVTVRNFGQLASNPQNLYLESDFIVNQTASIAIPSVSTNSSLAINDRLVFAFNQNIKDSQVVSLRLRTNEQIVDTFSIVVRSPRLQIESIAILPTAYSNGDRLPNPGELDSIVLRISNRSVFPLQNIKTNCTNAYKCVFIEPFSEIKQLNAGESVLVGSKMIFDTISSTSITPHFTIKSTSINTSDSVYQTFDLQYATETWEDSIMTNLPWQNKSPLPWTIDHEAHFGRFSLRSGAIPNDDSTVLQINFTLERADTVSFWYRTSCEDAYGTFPDIEFFDYLQFTLDQRKFRWAGVNEWNRFSLPIGAGNYTARWVYYKDSDNSYYADAAWIDNIKIPAPIKKFANITNAADTTVLISDSLCWKARFSVQPDEFGYYRYPAWLTNSSSSSLSGLPQVLHAVDTLVTWTKYNGNYRVQLFTIAKKDLPDTTDLKIVVFPQPTSKFSFIESNCIIDNVQITSICGQSLKSYQSIQSPNFKIVLENIPDGFYFLRIATNKGERLLPLIKRGN